MMQNEKTVQELVNIRNACGSRVILDGKSVIAPIDDKAFFDKCLMYSESKNLHAKNTVAWRPMPDNWKERCRSNSFWFQDTVAEAKKMFPGMDEHLFELKARLLDFAGEASLPAGIRRRPGEYPGIWSVLAWIQCRTDTGRAMPVPRKFCSLVERKP